ncbi:diguanylate cyclase [Falsirhodobacter algicola]|uniref:diguanylate cyclase n=1 Tax=Falsirhodobacter algicola TaxID=2692330 RepID=A0A8J8SJY7_9RHOB|nr:diguanylate cyclase [Falsirhodobacter algicola]QUS34797.1 diguanylate cyclase [Falsirhodobacter algicola]
MSGQILVIDPVPGSRTVTKMRLASECYAASVVSSVEEAALVARVSRPEVVILDSSDPMPALRRIRADMRLRDLPIVVLTDPATAAFRLQAVQAGAAEVLFKPVEDVLLMARLRAVLRLHARLADSGHEGLAEEASDFDMPATIAIVAARGCRLEAELGAHLRRRPLLLSREDALRQQAADLYLVEIDAAGAWLRLLADLRARLAPRNVPICVLQGHADAATAALAWDMGADDLVPAGASAAEIALRLSGQLRLKHRLDNRRASVAQGLRMAMVDPLTGLHNRRFAMPRLDAMSKEDMAVLLVDLDRFKSVNDRWGHAAGDAVLTEIARRLSGALPPGALAARIGGEEFLIALPQVQLAEARLTADTLCRAVSETPIALPNGGDLQVTVSVGLATRRKHDPEPVSQTVERADRALLQSKEMGRDRVTVGSSEAPWRNTA